MEIEAEENPQSISTSIILREEQMKRVKVPGDGSCLFWAVALPYLIQVNNNVVLFNERFESLFGAKELNHSHHVRHLITNFHTLHDDSIYDDEILRTLVTRVFRHKLVDRMSQCEDQFYQSISIDDFKDMKNEYFVTDGTFRDNFEKAFPLLIKGSDIDLDRLKPEILDKNTIAVINGELDKIVKLECGDLLQRFKFRMYLEAMKSCSSWGGNHEIEMMKRMLECEILVNFENQLVSTRENSIICLFNNQQIHYHFFLIKAQFLIEFIDQNSEAKNVEYLKIGVDEINYQNSNGSTLLHFAVKNNHVRLINLLISQGANTSYKIHLGQFSFDIAASLNSQDSLTTLNFNVKQDLPDLDSNQKSIVSLISSRADKACSQNEISETNLNNSTVLASEIKFNQIGRTALGLHTATKDGHKVNLREMLSSLVQDEHHLVSMVNTPTREECKQTALHLAAKNNRVKAVEMLLESKADVNVRDVDSEGFPDLTPLHYAAEKGHLDIVKLLVGKGKAEIDAPDRTRGTPLQRAVRFGQLSVVKYLVGIGADVNSKDETSISVFSYAAKAGCLNVVHFLVEKGAEINAVDKNNITPLHHAANSSKWDIVKYLVERGADPNVTSKNNKTIMTKVVEAGQWRLAKLLIENGALTDGLTEEQINEVLKRNSISLDGEDAIYTLIGLGNSELLEKHINKLVEINPSFLNDNLPKIYEQIKLLNIPISQSVSLIIESHIIKSRLFSHRKINETSVNIKEHHAENIQLRINAVVNAITTLEEWNVDLSDNNIHDIFFFLLTLIAENMQLLKNKLHFSFDKLPWIEMQFCLVNFISGFSTELKHTEVIYKIILNKARLLKHLRLFKTEIQKLEINVKLENKYPFRSRKELVDSVVESNSSFKELYEDYELLRDVYSLKRIESYLNPACLVDLNKGDVLVGEQMILRALQVTGECLKNTIESPNMSDNVHHLLITLAPKNVIKIVTSLRDSLSHVEHLHKWNEAKQNSSVDIQKDLIKLKEEISYLLYWKRNIALEIFIKRIPECHSIKKATEIISGVRDRESITIEPSDKQNAIVNKVAELLEKFKREIKNQTNIQQIYFKKIDNAIKKQKLRLVSVEKNYFAGKLKVTSLINAIANNGKFHIIQKRAKDESLRLNFQKTKNDEHFCEVILENCYLICNSLDDGGQSVRGLYNQIFHLLEFEAKRVKSIDKFRREIAKEMKFDDGIERNVNNILTNICKEILDKEIQNQFLKEIEIKREIFRSKNILIAYYSKINDIYGNVIDFFNLLFSFYNEKKKDRRLEENNFAKLIEENRFVELLAEFNLLGMIDQNLLFALCSKKCNLNYKNKKIKDEERVSCLIDEIELKSVTDQIKRDLSLDESSFSAYMVNVQLINLKKSETLFNDSSFSKCKTMLNGLEKMDAKFDSFGKLIKDVSKESEIAKLREPFHEFIKSLCTNFSVEIANAIDQSFEQIKNEKMNQLKSYYFEKLELLMKIFPNEKTDLELLALLKTDDNIRIAVEMLVLNLTETLDQLSLFESNSFYLDELSPVLVGKNLRNYLAHGDPLIDIIPTNYLISLINHFRLFQREFHTDGAFYPRKQLIGKVRKENIVEIQNFFQDNLQILHKKIELFKSIKDGAFDDFIKLIGKPVNLKVRNPLGGTLLDFSARANNLSVFHYLIEQDLNIFQEDMYGHNVLYTAVTTGNERLIEFLLDKGFDPSFIVEDNETLLHFAAQCGQVNIVRLLLRNGADIAAVNNKGFTPIIMAILNAHENIVVELLDAGSDLEWRAEHDRALLHFATSNEEILKTLLKLNVNVDALDQDLTTPLHSACIKGEEVIVETLLDNAANVNNQNKDGVTALHFAALGGYTNIVELLLQNRNVEIDLTNSEKNTALHLACFPGHSDVVSLLLKYGADVNVRNADDRTALHIASMVGHVQLIDILIDHEVEIDSLCDDMTALHIAAEYGKTKVFKRLVDRGANMFLKVFKGGSVLHLASLSGNIEIMEFILEKEKLNLGKSEFINMIDDEGRTALHAAVATNKPESIHFLIEKNAEIEAQDFEGKTALFAAALKDRAVIFNILLSKRAKIDARDKRGWLVLHAAAQNNCLAMVNALIIQRKVNVNVEITADGAAGMSALHLAALNGHLEMVTLLLKNGAEIDSGSANGWTALHYASIYGQSEIVDYLLKKNAKNDFSNWTDGATPLHLAAEDGHFRVLEILLKYNKTYVNVLFADKTTALEVAVENGSVSCAKLLIENGADVNVPSVPGRTILHHAAMKGNLEIMRILLENKADVINLSGKDGRTALHLATRGGHSDVVKYLLTKCANPNLKCEGGVSALHIASDSGFFNVVNDILLHAETEINIADENGQTPLHRAAFRNHVGIVQLLLNNVADVNAADQIYRNTPLHDAAFNGNFETVRVLLNGGATVDSINKDEVTPLYGALFAGHLEIADELIKLGADVNKKNGKQSTPLHVAIDQNKSDIVKYLLSVENIDVNARNIEGATPLHFAASLGHLETAKMLIKAGADINCVDNKNYTPLHVAMLAAHCHLVKLLAENGAFLLVLIQL